MTGEISYIARLPMRATSGRRPPTVQPESRGPYSTRGFRHPVKLRQAHGVAFSFLIRGAA